MNTGCKQNIAKVIQLSLCAGSLLSLELAAWEGATEAEVQTRLGLPTAHASSGDKAIWIYKGIGSLFFENDRVDVVKGTFPPFAVEPTYAAAEPAMVGAMGFEVPIATVITERDFHINGSWGGETFGLVEGPDGQPLSAHRLYANDSRCFAKRMEVGAQVLDGSTGQHRRTSLARFLRSGTAERTAQSAIYQAQFGHAPSRDPLFSFVRYEIILEKAVARYELAYKQVQALEAVGPAARIDLDAEVEGDRALLREQMIDALAEMHETRGQWLQRYPRYFDAGKQSQFSQWPLHPVREGKTVLAPDTPCVVAQRIDRTPVRLGFALADAGEIPAETKPLLLPAGIPVEVLDTATVAAPADAPIPGKQLAINKIRFKATGVKTHQGQVLQPVTFEGWVLAQSLH